MEGAHRVEEWHDFFLAVAGAAAVLAGLVHLRRLVRDEKSKELRSVEVRVASIHELPRRGIFSETRKI
jgi:hypothetical protein